MIRKNALLWRHNGRGSVSNHQPHNCYSTVYSDADQRKHQCSASLASVRGIHRGPVNSPHKWPVTRKMYPFDDVIMGNITERGGIALGTPTPVLLWRPTTKAAKKPCFLIQPFALFWSRWQKADSCRINHLIKNEMKSRTLQQPHISKQIWEEILHRKYFIIYYIEFVSKFCIKMAYT